MKTFKSKNFSIKTVLVGSFCLLLIGVLFYIQGFSQDFSVVALSYFLAGLVTIFCLAGYTLSLPRIAEHHVYMLAGSISIVAGWSLTFFSETPLELGLSARALDLLGIFFGPLYLYFICRDNANSKDLFTLCADATMVWLAICMGAFLFSAGFAPHWWKALAPVTLMLVIQVVYMGLLIGLGLVVYGALPRRGLWIDILLSSFILGFIYIVLSLISVLYDFSPLSGVSRLSRVAYLCAAIAIAAFVILSPDRLNKELEGFARSKNQAWISGVPMLISVPLALVLLWICGFNMPSVTTLLIIVGVGNIAILLRYALLANAAAYDRRDLARLVTIDELTGILNRRGLLLEFPSTLLDDDYLLCIDLDDFKSVNDLYGHDVGDDLLRAIAQDLSKLSNVVRCGRLGGDEFIAIARSNLQIETVANDIHHALSKWRYLRGKRVFVGVSIGAALAGRSDLVQLLVMADTAMYKAKHGGHGFNVYIPEILNGQTRQEHREMIQSTIDSGELYLHYQPIYCLLDGRCVGVEALLRMRDQSGKILSPSEFLQVSRDVGQLRELTLLLADHFVAESSELDGIQLQINLPPDLAIDRSFREMFIHRMQAVGFALSQFTLEITEEASVPLEQLAEAAKELSQMGFRLAIDDFGSAHSSIARLAAIEVDEVKIDQALLKAAGRGQVVLLESALLMARRLGKVVTCEGIESLEDLRMVRKLGVNKGQGYLLGKPVAASEFVAADAHIDLDQWI